MTRAFIITFLLVIFILIAVGGAFWLGTQNPDTRVNIPEVDVDINTPSEQVQNPSPTLQQGSETTIPSPTPSPTNTPTPSQPPTDQDM